MKQVIRRKFAYFLLLVVLFFFWERAIGQDNIGDPGDYGGYNNSFQLWPSVKISKDFKYGLSASAQYLLRADVTGQRVAGNFFYVGVKYKQFRYLHLDFKFRGVNSPERNLYRFEFGIKPRYRYKNWTFAFRTAYFNEREYFARVYEHGRYPTNYWRNRIEVRWDFKKYWGAYVSSEVYTLFDYRGMNTRRVAFIAGIDYTFLKMHNVDVYYMAQPDFNKKSPNLIQAISFVYTWDIPKSFKKKKKKKNK